MILLIMSSIPIVIVHTAKIYLNGSFYLMEHDEINIIRVRARNLKT